MDNVPNMSTLLSDEDTDVDSLSDGDADTVAEDLYDTVINVIGHIVDGTALGPGYFNLLDAYHRRFYCCPCKTSLSSDEAKVYHLKLLVAVLETYYGPDYTCVFVPDLVAELSSDMAPTDAQVSAMFPDERVPYLLHYRLMEEGIMEQLPALLKLEDLGSS